MCTSASYNHIRALVGNRTAELKHQWETEGIIYEGDFGFSSMVLEHEWPAIMKFLREIGCEMDDGLTSVIAAEVADDGWMYAGFDTERHEYPEVEEMIKEKFGQKNP